jgi:cysteine-rich repeat protein
VQCKAFWADDLMTGTSGDCIEKCGDGKNFGFNSCDDGNNNNGDGCSSNCFVEKGYYCRGGYQGNQDHCYYISTEIERATIDAHNNLLLKFSKPVMINYLNLTQRDLDISIFNRNKTKIPITWKAMVDYLPSSYIYIVLNLDNDV